MLSNLPFYNFLNFFLFWDGCFSFLLTFTVVAVICLPWHLIPSVGTTALCEDINWLNCIILQQPVCLALSGFSCLAWISFAMLIWGCVSRQEAEQHYSIAVERKRHFLWPSLHVTQDIFLVSLWVFVSYWKSFLGRISLRHLTQKYFPLPWVYAQLQLRR